MNYKKYLIALSIQLLISGYALNAAPFAYVVNTGQNVMSVFDNSVSVIDTATNIVVATVQLSATPSAGIAVTPDNKTVYVPCSNPNTIQRIDVATNTHILPDIQMGALAQPKFIAISPDGLYAYVSCSDSTVKRINIATNAIDVTIPGFTIPLEIVIAPNGLTAYVSDNPTGVVPIDLATNMLGTHFPVASPQGLAITADNAYAYVTIAAAGVLNQLNLSNRLAPTISNSVNVGTNPVSVALTPDGQSAYVANAGTNNVTPISISNPASLIAGTVIPVGSGPIEIVITPNGKTAYVSNNGTNTVTPIDLITNTPEPIVTVGDAPYGIAISAAPAIGTHRSNAFFDKTERIITITWSGINGISSYNIYNGTTLIGTVSATCPLTFSTLLTNCDNGENISIAGVNSLGMETTHIAVIIT